LPGKSHGQRSLVGCSPWGLIDTKSGKSLAVKSKVLYAEDEEALMEDLKSR